MKLKSRKMPIKLLTSKELHPYQREVANMIVNNDNLFVFLEMGLGKTAITLLAINYLQTMKGYKSALILAPLRVVYNSWPSEIQKWADLSRTTWHIIHDKGKIYPLPKKNLYIANYESIPYIVEKKLYKNCDIFVADESTFLKSHKTKTRFKKLKKIMGGFKKKIMLTGTPSPSGELWELWAQTFLLDGGERLGKNFTSFRNKYYDSDFMGYKYTLKPNSRKQIESLIKEISVSAKASDYIDMPDKIIRDVVITIPDKTRERYYNEMEKTFMLSCDQGVITAANAAVMSSKLRQIVSGKMYGEDRYIIHVHEEKIKALKDIVETTQGNILCGFQFKFEKDSILRSIPHAQFIDGDTSATKSSDIIEKWNKKEIKLLCCHPSSAAHGINLQFGGNTLVWLSMDWSLEKTTQFEARLYRQGQKRPVFIYRIIAKDTIDIIMINRLKDKSVGQESLIKAIKKYVDQKI